MQSSIKETTDETRGLKIALGVYVLVLVMKLVAYGMTGVMALLAEGLHTFSDVFISGFLLVAALVSRRRADAEHMYGHGRAQNVAALVAAVLFVSFTALRLYEEAIPRLFAAHEANHQNLGVALAVLVVSMVISAAPLVSIWRQKERGPAARAQLLECLNDELGLLAALVGTLFILFGVPIADPIASIVVATIIVVNAIGLFRDNLSYLLGRSPGPEFLRRIENEVRAVPGVLEVHKLRAEYIGPQDVHLVMDVRVARGTPIEEADRISKEVRQRIKDEIDLDYCVVHVDPALPVAAPPDSPAPVPGRDGHGLPAK